MTVPTPEDARVWTYHLLGWPTRRIATEVGSSQSTISRIIQRIKDDPDYQKQMGDAEATAVFAAMATPPNGFRVSQVPTQPEQVVTEEQLRAAADPRPTTMLQPVSFDDTIEPIPPRQPPASHRKPSPWPQRITLLLAIAALLLAALAWKTAHNATTTPGPQGKPGPAGQQGQPGTNRVRLCVRFDNVTGDISTVYGTKTDCGPNRLLIKVP
jgi:hypothetical protein